MSMSTAYLTVVANAGKAAVTHVGLVDGGGTEIVGGSYARQAVTWNEGSGLLQLSGDELFDIPAGAIVAGWRGFDALTLGTNYGGASLTSQTFATAGQYKLLAASTSIDHNAS